MAGGGRAQANRDADGHEQDPVAYHHAFERGLRRA